MRGIWRWSRAAWTACPAIALAVALAWPASPCRGDAAAQPTPPEPAQSGAETPAAPTAAAPAAKEAPPKTAGAGKEDDEVRLGRRAALELEKEYKLVRDPQQVGRLERIGRDIQAVCDEPDYRFTFRILDSEEINALSLPGGFTYATKGMMGYVRSDDELAGVLAHEIAHAAHHHVRELIKREESMNRYVILGALGAVLLGRGATNNLGNMLLSAEILKTAYLNQYGQQAEMDADRTGVEYVIKTRKYNPVGLLTLIERLARDEERQAGPAPGVFRTHPPGAARSKALEEYIRAQGFPISRWAVQDRFRAGSRDATAGDQVAGDVILDSTVLFQTAAGAAAAEKIAEHLNRLLERDLQMRDVGVAADGVTVVVAGEPLLTVTDADALLSSKPANAVAANVARALSRVLWRIHLDRVS